MKTTGILSRIVMIVLAALLVAPVNVRAQDEEESSPFSVGGDIVSSYVWRGTLYGNSPAIQPYVEFGAGGFSIGGWGSYDFNGFAEADLYASYGFDFGLSIGITDYYYRGTRYFNFNNADDDGDDVGDGAHGFEINLGYEIAGLALSANYMLNEAGAAGTAGGDLYFELGYSFKYFGIHAGAGNGWHTMEDPADPDESDFNFCNIGITASKEISITEKFSLPVSGALIWNPDSEQYHVVVGVSF